MYLGFGAFFSPNLFLFGGKGFLGFLGFLRWDE